MLQKFNITTCAFILCLFGLTLITESTVFAEDSAAYIECQQIQPHGEYRVMKQKKNCFRDLARALNAPQEVPTTSAPRKAVTASQSSFDASIFCNAQNETRWSREKFSNNTYEKIRRQMIQECTHSYIEGFCSASIQGCK